MGGAQPLKHDTDLLFGRELPACAAPDLAYCGLLLLLPPLLLVAAAFLLAPNPVAGEQLELRAHFERVARPALLLLAAFSLLSLFADWFIALESPLDRFSLLALVYTALLIAAALSERVWVRAVALAVHWAVGLPLAVGLLPAPGW